MNIFDSVSNRLRRLSLWVDAVKLAATEPAEFLELVASYNHHRRCQEQFLKNLEAIAMRAHYVTPTDPKEVN